MSTKQKRSALSIKDKQMNLLPNACPGWKGQSNIDPIQIHVMQLQQMMDFAMQSLCRSLKQTSMLEHFRAL